MMPVIRDKQKEISVVAWEYPQKTKWVKRHTLNRDKCQIYIYIKQIYVID